MTYRMTYASTLPSVARLSSQERLEASERWTLGGWSAHGILGWRPFWHAFKVKALIGWACWAHVGRALA